MLFAGRRIHLDETMHKSICRRGIPFSRSALEPRKKRAYKTPEKVSSLVCVFEVTMPDGEIQRHAGLAYFVRKFIKPLRWQYRSVYETCLKKGEYTDKKGRCWKFNFLGRRDRKWYLPYDQWLAEKEKAEKEKKEAVTNG